MDLSISDLEHKIRNYINRPRKQSKLLKDSTAWNMLCSCLDVIGDTELAIQAYKDFKNLKKDGFKYLTVYGILQTLFLQQDAINPTDNEIW
jgi:hypothetical protein